jgi:hypothetical protein
LRVDAVGFEQGAIEVEDERKIPQGRNTSVR